MNFESSLEEQIQESPPEWRDKFISYKDLKEHVRLISSAPSELPESSHAEAEFMYLLNSEMDKFNSFLIGQEEELIIRLIGLKKRFHEAMDALSPIDARPLVSTYREELQKIRNDFLNLHGELELMENCANVNGTGLAKFLKKYDKRTGRLSQLPVYKDLKPPIFPTDFVLNLVKAVKECENTLEIVFIIIDDDDE